MRKIFFILLIVSFIITIFINYPSAENYQFEDFAVERAMYINEKWCTFREELTMNNRITRKQAANRINAIKYWSKEFNHMYDIDYKRVWKDITAIAELETGFVNWNSRIKDGERYGVLDNGKAFGVFSMLWETAYWIASINNWQLESREDEIKLILDPTEQAKYAVWYYYWLLKQKEDRLTVLVAYNQPTVSPNEDRWRNYFMQVYGIVSYYEEMLSR